MKINLLQISFLYSLYILFSHAIFADYLWYITASPAQNMAGKKKMLLTKI